MSLTENEGENQNHLSIPQETIAVYSAPDMVAAELLRGQLEVEGIDAVIGEQVTGVYAGALAIGEGYAAEVRVPADSVEQAQAIVLTFMEQMESGAMQPVSDEDLAAQAEASYDPNV
ncbi:MAG: DUF2007 domain-containing protein [Armatimonadota bacterium]